MKPLTPDSKEEEPDSKEKIYHIPTPLLSAC